MVSFSGVIIFVFHGKFFLWLVFWKLFFLILSNYFSCVFFFPRLIFYCVGWTFFFSRENQKRRKRRKKNVFLIECTKADMAGLYSLIKFCFDMGLRLWEIVQSLSHIDGISINLSTLCI